VNISKRKEKKTIDKYPALYNCLSTIRFIIHASNIILEEMEIAQNNFNYTSEAYLSVIPLFKSYLTYCARYNLLAEELAQFRNWKDGKEILMKLEFDLPFKNLAIESLAIMPVRRIPRYILLFNEYKKYNTSDLNANAVVEMLNNLSQIINDQIRKWQLANP